MSGETINGEPVTDASGSELIIHAAAVQIGPGEWAAHWCDVAAPA